MCLLVIAWKSHPRYRLIMAGNRDEFHDRAAAPLGWWQDDARILAPRDLKAMGTWQGVARSGRFAAVTNFRDLKAPADHAPSRGVLVPRFLTGATSPKEFLDDLKGAAPRYSGFNLLVGGPRALYYFSNRGDEHGAQVLQSLKPGIYGISNHLLDTPWDKLTRTRDAIRELLWQPEIAVDQVFAVLANRQRTPDQHLPNTGLPLEWERTVSAPFIVNERFGTRCSHVVLVERTGRTIVHERRFDPDGTQSGVSRFEFKSADIPDTWVLAEDNSDPLDSIPVSGFDTLPE